MRESLKSWLVAILLVGSAAYAIAEDVTLTTYYPSPRGVYQELRWGTGGALQADQGASIELWGGGRTPYIDFCNTAGCPEDFDMRLILSGDDALSIEGGNVVIDGTGFPTLDVFTPGFPGRLHIGSRDVRTTADDTLYFNWNNASGNVQVGGEGEMKLLNVVGDVSASREVRACTFGPCSHLRWPGNGDNYMRGNLIVDGFGGTPANLNIAGDIRFTSTSGGGTISRGGRLHIQADEFLYLNPWTGASTVFVGGGGGPGNFETIGWITAGGNITSQGFTVCHWDGAAWVGCPVCP